MTPCAPVRGCQLSASSGCNPVPHVLGFSSSPVALLVLRLFVTGRGFERDVCFGFQFTLVTVLLNTEGKLVTSTSHSLSMHATS